MKRHHTHFTCVTCSIPIKTGKQTCSYAASTSRRIHTRARYKARNSWVTSPAGSRLSYLQFAGEFTRGVISDCLQLQVFLAAIMGYFSCECVGIFACVCRYFCQSLAGIYTCDFSVFPENCMCFCQ